LNASKHATMITISKCMKLERGYTKVSVNKLIELLKTWHNRNINRRWCFQITRDLEDGGFIRRRNRYKKTAQYPYGQQSSLFSITLKGAYYLLQNCVVGARELLAQIKSLMKGNDNRFPTPELKAETFTNQEIFDNKGRLKALIETLA